MASSLVTALVITIIGMTLLFLTLALFYGLLSLMMAPIKDRPASADSLEAKGEYVKGEEERDREEAAAIAVALARAEAEQEAGYAAARITTVPDGVATGQQVSSWWALHHQRQMMRRGTQPRRTEE